LETVVILVPSGLTVDFIVVGGRGAMAVWLVLREDEPCDELLCKDDLWLEPLDFARAGAAASAAATSAMDNDQTSFDFTIVIPPEIRSSEK
jgi:hypothetical protein